MTNNLILQIVAALALAVVGLLLINPFGMWMPTMMHMLILGIVTAVFGAFSVFVIAERSQDERDDAHKAYSGRAAFLAGGAVLLFGIITQTLKDASDPWLVAALVVMVLVKIGSRIYNARYR